MRLRGFQQTRAGARGKYSHLVKKVILTNLPGRHLPSDPARLDLFYSCLLWADLLCSRRAHLLCPFPHRADLSGSCLSLVAGLDTFDTLHTARSKQLASWFLSLALHHHQITKQAQDTGRWGCCRQARKLEVMESRTAFEEPYAAAVNHLHQCHRDCYRQARKAERVESQFADEQVHATEVYHSRSLAKMEHSKRAWGGISSFCRRQGTQMKNERVCVDEMQSRNVEVGLRDKTEGMTLL